MKKIIFFVAALILFCLPIYAQEYERLAFPPPQGPYRHSIYSASSKDGLNWTLDSEKPLAEHASVPTAMQFKDGVIRVYFVDFSYPEEGERLGCLASIDNGETYQRINCQIKGMDSKKAVDFCITELPNKDYYRMYYYAFDEGINSAGGHHIDSAISDDGRLFVHEKTVFTYNGLVDPDVFWNGKRWIMHVFSLDKNATVVAVSDDGISFVYYQMLSPSGFGVTKPVKLPDGGFRMYGFPQPNSNSIVSFISKDGLKWVKEPGIRISFPFGDQVTDPFVILLQDGTYKMYLKVEKYRTSW